MKHIEVAAAIIMAGHLDFDIMKKELQIDLSNQLKQEEESTKELRKLLEEIGYEP